MGSQGTGSFWHLLASLSPFESWRKYLIDRHERDQDRRFRDPAEARKLELENEARELANIEKRGKIAKQLGATKEQLQPLCERALGYRDQEQQVVIARTLPQNEQLLLTDGAKEEPPKWSKRYIDAGPPVDAADSKS